MPLYELSNDMFLLAHPPVEHSNSLVRGGVSSNESHSMTMFTHLSRQPLCRLASLNTNETCNVVIFYPRSIPNLTFRTKYDRITELTVIVSHSIFLIRIRTMKLRTYKSNNVHAPLFKLSLTWQKIMAWAIVATAYRLLRASNFSS